MNISPFFMNGVTSGPDPFPVVSSKCSPSPGRLSGSRNFCCWMNPQRGIQPSIVDQICEILKKISVETGLTILIVEQNVDMIMDLAAGCSFMEKGQIEQTCSIDDIRMDESIITCHMGV